MQKPANLSLGGGVALPHCLHAGSCLGRNLPTRAC
jgi:hypothetical protein